MSSTQSATVAVARYTAYDHHGQWFVKGPDDYLLRAGYGFKGKQLASLAVYAWDALRHVKADDVTDQLPALNSYRSHYDTDTGTWSVHGPEGTRMPTGSGKRGEYHAKMLAFVGNGYRKQAHWYHNTVYPRAVYVQWNTVLLDVSTLDYPGNPLIAALADPANPEHFEAYQHLYRQCSTFIGELFTDGTMDKIKSAIDMCVKRAERFATVREAALAFEDDPASAGRDLVGSTTFRMDRPLQIGNECKVFGGAIGVGKSLAFRDDLFGVDLGNDERWRNRVECIRGSTDQSRRYLLDQEGEDEST